MVVGRKTGKLSFLIWVMGVTMNGGSLPETKQTNERNGDEDQKRD